LKHLLHHAANYDPLSRNLDQEKQDEDGGAEEALLEKLQGMNDESSPNFEPSVFCTWDLKDLPAR
jgi:hypothetical protein